jgi:hypothetical protein
MNPVGQSVPPIEPDGRGIVFAEALREPSKVRKMVRRTRKRQSDPTLEVPSTVISDAAIRGLIDDSIVPALVEKFVQEKCSFPTEKSHNGQQP